SLLLPPAPSRICTLSLHDALPIYRLRGLDLLRVELLLVVVRQDLRQDEQRVERGAQFVRHVREELGLVLRAERTCRTNCAPRSTDRKSTRLNSSHRTISYAVFCLK